MSEKPSAGLRQIHDNTYSARALALTGFYCLFVFDWNDQSGHKMILNFLNNSQAISVKF
jgi:hypothetical protein